MIIVKLYGGLGNQMFQYALGRNLALRNKTELKFDVTGLEQDKLRHYELDIFNISATIASKSEIMLIRKSSRGINSRILRILSQHYFCIKQKDLYFDATIKGKKGDIYLDGYWQCENYFKNIRDIIVNDFIIKYNPDERNKSMLEKIDNSNSVCIHVRRGDYVYNKKTRKVHGTCSFEYYNNAVNIIGKKVRNPEFFIFSDDLQWTKANLKFEYPFIYVDINNTEKGYEDLRLMSRCKHFIIANSSFSWWAAWLSNNADKIICAPSRWFNSVDEGDIVPKSWLRIEC